jgi:uncharacterized protein (DUF4415 family)
MVSKYGVPDDDNPELTAEDFARAKPFREVYPEHYKAWKKLGRPPVVSPKVHIGFRLAADVVAGIRATGRRYNARVEKVLREALAKGELSSDPPPAGESASARRPNSRSGNRSPKRDLLKKGCA